MAKCWLAIVVSSMVNKTRTEAIGDKLSRAGRSGRLILLCYNE